MYLSRRGFLLLLGAGFGSAALASTCDAPWAGQSRRLRTVALGDTGDAAAYVDHDGWMLTAAEKERLGPVEAPVPPEP
jgi:hypothetical protein